MKPNKDDEMDKDLTVGFDGELNEGDLNPVEKQVQGTEVEDPKPAAPEVNEIAAAPAPEISEPKNETKAGSVVAQEATGNPALAEAPKEESEPALDNQPQKEEVAGGVGSVAADKVVSAETLESASNQISKEEKRKVNSGGKNNKAFIALFIVFMALILAGGAVYVYLSTEGSTNKVDNPSSSQNQQEEITPATPEDIEQTTQEVDEAVDALDDTTDFSETDLSDESLGL